MASSSVAPSGYTYMLTQESDAWDLLAFRAYGEETLMTALLDANPALQRTVQFDAGVQVLVPQASPSIPLPAPPWRTIVQLG